MFLIRNWWHNSCVAVTSLTSECSDQNALRSRNFTRFWRDASSLDRFICQRLHPVVWITRRISVPEKLPLYEGDTVNVCIAWMEHSGKKTALLHTPQRGVRFNFRDVYWGPDSVVSISTGYGLDDQGVGVRVPVGSRIFSSRRPDRLWGPQNLLFNGCRGLVPQGQSARGVELTTHLQLVPRSRKCESVHPLPYTSSWHSG
jgi:hypothetical protein